MADIELDRTKDELRVGQQYDDELHAERAQLEQHLSYRKAGRRRDFKAMRSVAEIPGQRKENCGAEREHSRNVELPSSRKKELAKRKLIALNSEAPPLVRGRLRPLKAAIVTIK